MAKRLFAALLAAALLCGCGPAEMAVQKTVFAMDTVADLQLWGPEAQAGVEAAEKALADWEAEWSASADGSFLSQLNRGEAVPTAEEQAVLSKAEALSRRTGGAFDPKLYRLTAAWGFFSGEYRVPSQAEIDAALAAPEWDLGAVIKGYAGEKLTEMLAEADVDRAILNLGGNVQTYGEKPDGSPWQIALQNPRGEGYAGVLSVHGTMAVVTSGDYQRYFEQDGVRYHHIMDPATGRPADSGLASVTVICRDGMTADALSTALFVLGLEEGSRLWRESDDFEAVFIRTSGEIYATEGAGLSGCEFEVIAREN